VDRLSPLGFDFFPILVVDLLHEFELGILKAVMMHLMRLLYAVDPRKLATINERYHVSLALNPSPYHTIHMSGSGQYLRSEVPFEGFQIMFHV
jgi:hypothetical protein